MLAEGRTSWRSNAARGAVLLVLAVLVAVLVMPIPVRGDLPVVEDTGNASRTVTWMMNDTAGMTAQNITTEGGRASLPWAAQSLTWNTAADFAANGTLARGMVANASGVGLWGNTSSVILDGGFATRSGWTYANGTSNNVTAEWNSTRQSGELHHLSSVDETMWDNMDAVTTNWTLASTGGVGGVLEVKQQPEQGSGMMGIQVVTWSGSYMGALRLLPTTTDWSAYNRLVVWVKMNQSMAVGFNVTAHVGTRLVGTTNQSLVAGWQQISVDLDQLGTSADRVSLTQVTLRFNAASVPSNTWFFVDNARLGLATVFSEGASISQTFAKANVTTPLPGSATLAFDWCVWNATGVVNYTAAVNLTGGPALSFESSLNPAAGGAWHSFSADVSATTSAARSYTLSFRLWANVNTTAASNLTWFLDNVTLIFPDRQNGTYLSRALTLGSDSEYLELSWAAVIPDHTTLTFGIRSGNNTNPNSGLWSGWETFSAQGSYGLTIPGATYFQIEAVLGTTNASRTPFLQSYSLASRHRLSTGVLVSELYPASGDFLTWASFNVSRTTPPLTSIVYYVGNGTDWTQVAPDSDVSFVAGPHFQWRAVLTSFDGLLTPAILSVKVTYEYLGPPTRVVVFYQGIATTPGSAVNLTVGEYAHFSATVYDAGSHSVPSAIAPLIWQTNDTQGIAYQNGTYLPGSPGLHWLNVTISGYALFASIPVNVSPAGVGPLNPSGDPWALWPLYLVAIGAVTGFAVYEVAIRRMFAIDDVFLIAKDGRLIIHNTRRMRADRDEDILSGMLTAIMAFLRDQDPEENGELKRFQVGGKTTLLERGEHVYLSAIYSGRVPGWAGKDLHRFMVDLEDRFGDAFAHWSGSPEDLRDLKGYMQRFVTHVRYRGDWGNRKPEN